MKIGLFHWLQRKIPRDLFVCLNSNVNAALANSNSELLALIVVVIKADENNGQANTESKNTNQTILNDERGAT